MFSSDCKSSRDRVVLPAPDGEERTSIKPRRLMSALILWVHCACLFDILGLLAELVDRRLQREAYARQRYVGRLGTERVRLAIEVLGQEIESASHRFAGSHQQ